MFNSSWVLIWWHVWASLFYQIVCLLNHCKQHFLLQEQVHFNFSQLCQFYYFQHCELYSDNICTTVIPLPLATKKLFGEVCCCRWRCEDWCQNIANKSLSEGVKLICEPLWCTALHLCVQNKNFNNYLSFFCALVPANLYIFAGNYKRTTQ